MKRIEEVSAPAPAPPTLTVTLVGGQVKVSGQVESNLAALRLLHDGMNAILGQMAQEERQSPGIVVAQAVPKFNGV